MQIRKPQLNLSTWFYAFAVTSLFLCFITMFQSALPQFTGIFNLRNENNLGALFSGMFLIIIALHAFDGWANNRTQMPKVATAWLLLSLVLFALSFDEIGSLHERAGWIGDWSAWLTLLPFGIVFGAMVGYSVVTLYNAPGQRPTAVLISIGFMLLASVALQEHIEHTLDWTANRYLRFFKARLRPVVEEGSELLGMLVIFWATLKATHGHWRSREQAGLPILEGVVSLRRCVLITGLVGAPLVAYFTVSLPLSRHDHGMPADWPAATFFLLAALAAASPRLNSGRSLAVSEWGLVAVALLGCASTILPPDSVTALPLMTALIFLACILWALQPWSTPGAFLPAPAFLCLCLGLAWLSPQNDMVVYTLSQYTALAMYWVNTSSNQTARRALPETGFRAGLTTSANANLRNTIF